MVESKPPTPSPAARLRLAGIAFVALGVAGYLAPHFVTAAPAAWLRAAASSLVLLGVAALFFSVLARPRRPDAPPAAEAASIDFGRDTTEFADVSPPGDARPPRPPA